MKKIVFIGASRFGMKCLETVLSIRDIKVVGVVTAPKFFSISYSPDRPVENVLHSDFYSVCKERGIDIYCLHKNMHESSLYEKMKEWNPDLILVVGWYHMIPKTIRDIPRLGTIGFHASELPRYRGGAPLVWAMIQGEKTAGLSLFFLEDGVDTGDLIAQESVPILFKYTIADLYAKIEEAGVRILKRDLVNYLEGRIIPYKQLPVTGIREKWPQRSPEDGKISWQMPVLELYNFIRAQTAPYPGAFTYCGTNKITVWEAEPCFYHTYRSEPGAILDLVDDSAKYGILAATAYDDAPILIKKVSCNGKVVQDMRKIFIDKKVRKFHGGGGKSNCIYLHSRVS